MLPTTIHLLGENNELLYSRLRSLGYGVVLYPSAQSLLSALPTLNGGCALIDLEFALETAVGSVRLITAAGKALGTVVRATSGDVAGAVHCLKLGAVDVIAREPDEQRLLDALNAAFVATSAITEMALFRLRLERLTTRERDVFAGIASGESNKATASRLKISPRTVEVHRIHLMLKLQAKSRVDLIKMATKANQAQLL